MTARLAATGVVVEVAGRRLVDEVGLSIDEGELVALVGPNGAGKSTLLACLAGDHRPTAGRVCLDSRPIGDWPARELARRRAVLLQDVSVSFPFTVAEVVAMGRAPWRGCAGGDDDAEAIESAMAETDVALLAGRTVPSLSGGERARVALARVLAQRADVLLLDEPTAALDLRHQEGVLRTARRVADGGGAVVVVLHDLELAAAYADRLVLLHDGRIAASGPPTTVLTPGLVQRVYGVRVHVRDDRDLRALLVVPDRRM